VADQLTDALEPRPIPLANGRELVTLCDAGDSIPKLPKREHDKPEWQTATKDLMRAAAGHGPRRFLTRIAIMHALYGKDPPPIGNPNDASPAPSGAATVSAIHVDDPTTACGNKLAMI
jgi:hypothetical protein